MKKRIGLILVLVIAFTLIVALPAGAGRAGRSNTAHLYLFEKDPAWTMVPGGMWGKMTYRMSGENFWFVFNGHDLPDEGIDYSLIYYPDPWPGTGLKVLGTGTSYYCDDEMSNAIHIKGAPDTGDLPMVGDGNYPAGAKIWLVPSSDVGAGTLIGWNPTMYLFEYELMTFDDTNAS